MISRIIASLPLFATATAFGFIGMTLLLAGMQAAECGCYVLRPND